MEIKKEELMRVISKNEDEIETLLAKERLLNNQVSSLSRENTNLKITIDKVVNENELLWNNIVNLKSGKKITEKDEQ